MSQVYEATCSAPVNIAVIKYWGKRDTKLILPTNSSLSVTLSQDDLRSTTTIRASETFSRDRLWLNGNEQTEGVNEGRTGACIREMKKLRAEAESKNSSLPKLASLPIHIVSENNFPTAAGLASSASGFAALAYTLYTLYGLSSTVSASQLSRIARQGSGSACRSVFGGYVAWEMGSAADGEDSLAVEVAPQSHWPEMDALICVVSDLKKGTSSTSGMQRTVETSPLLQHRIRDVVPRRMQQISNAILERDFETFANITMQDSNQFHAVCQDTHPPIFYMNDVSRAIITAVNELNRAAGRTIAAYTYDAGPNSVIYALKQDMPSIKGIISELFLQDFQQSGDAPAKPQGWEEKNVQTGFKGGVSRLIHTKVGDGPRTLDSKQEGLIGEDGMPMKR